MDAAPPMPHSKAAQPPPHPDAPPRADGRGQRAHKVDELREEAALAQEHEAWRHMT